MSIMDNNIIYIINIMLTYTILITKKRKNQILSLLWRVMTYNYLNVYSPPPQLKITVVYNIIILT